MRWNSFAQKAPTFPEQIVLVLLLLMLNPNRIQLHHQTWCFMLPTKLLADR